MAKENEQTVKLEMNYINVLDHNIVKVRDEKGEITDKPKRQEAMKYDKESNSRVPMLNKNGKQIYENTINLTDANGNNLTFKAFSYNVKALSAANMTPEQQKHFNANKAEHLANVNKKREKDGKEPLTNLNHKEWSVAFPKKNETINATFFPKDGEPKNVAVRIEKVQAWADNIVKGKDVRMNDRDFTVFKKKEKTATVAEKAPEVAPKKEETVVLEKPVTRKKTAKKEQGK